MKQFNRGDLVTSTNKYSEVFEKEGIYVGVTYMGNGKNYHVVGVQRKEDATTVFVEDEYIKLLATARHIPIPKFHKGDIVFFIDSEMIILSERDEELHYLCYNSVKRQVAWYEEALIEKEKPELKLPEGVNIESCAKLATEEDEDEDENEDNEDPNAEHNSNLMKDSMPTLEKKDH